MNKWIILFLSIIVVIWIYCGDFSPPNDVILNRIDELELKMDSINKHKDSIRTVIDSTHVKIVTNEKYYQERINTIIIQSNKDDSIFVSNYIKRYSDQNSLFNTK